MAITSCLTGPPFSISGNSIYSSSTINFLLEFHNSGDADQVKAYEWYLNGLLVIDNNRNFFSGSVPCGSSNTIGVRILTNDGWSGIKYRQFITCEIPEFSISGPEYVGEGNSFLFTVQASYPDGRTEDLTQYYTFTSTEGYFTGPLLTIPANAGQNSFRQVTITATRPDFPDVSWQITVFDNVQNAGFPYNLPITF